MKKTTKTRRDPDMLDEYDFSDRRARTARRSMARATRPTILLAENWPLITDY
jgi:hypothetical protein